MATFEVLCVTMHQNDFSKIREMNVRSNVVFANQADRVAYDETTFSDGRYAKMITTNTRGISINRNLSLTYASADICLIADDDVVYCDDLEALVLGEFEAHPDADIIVFNLESSDPKREQRKYLKTSKCSRLLKKTWSSVRIAFKLSSVRKANLWFAPFLGTGSPIIQSGEESLWQLDAYKKGLVFYTSNKTIGKIYFETSSWFTGRDEKYYFNRGGFYRAAKPKLRWFWFYYAAFQTRRNSLLPWRERIKWLRNGALGYEKAKPFKDFVDR